MDNCQIGLPRTTGRIHTSSHYSSLVNRWQYHSIYAGKVFPKTKRKKVAGNFIVKY